MSTLNRLPVTRYTLQIRRRSAPLRDPSEHRHTLSLPTRPGPRSCKRQLAILLSWRSHPPHPALPLTTTGRLKSLFLSPFCLQPRMKTGRSGRKARLLTPDLPLGRTTTRSSSAGRRTVCRSRCAAGMCLVLILLPVPELFGQDRITSRDVRLVAAISGFKPDSRADRERDWQPGGSGWMRLYFHEFFHADVGMSLARTRRKKEVLCHPRTGCGDPQYVGGIVFVTSARVGINARRGRLRPYGGVGLGWTFDAQSGRRNPYSGPTVTLDAGLEGNVNERFSIILEYRRHRQHWKNQYTSVLQDIYLTNHQVDLGFGFRPRTP